MTSKLSKLDIISSLKQASLKPGDSVFLHIDTIVGAVIDSDNRNQKLEIILDAFKEVLGKEGTLIVPTFTYSFTKNETFNPHKTLCNEKEMGIFPNFFLQQKEIQRSKDPNFSVAVWGKRKEELSKSKWNDSFGKGSIFDKVLLSNVKILCMGCSLDRATFIHYCENQIGVDYRFNKKFSGTIISSKKEKKCEVNYFVRNRELNLTTDLTLLKNALKAEGKLRISPLGRLALYCVNSEDFYIAAKELISNNEHSLTKQDIQHA